MQQNIDKIMLSTFSAFHSESKNIFSLKVKDIYSSKRFGLYQYKTNFYGTTQMLLG